MKLEFIYQPTGVIAADTAANRAEVCVEGILWDISSKEQMIDDSICRSRVPIFPVAAAGSRIVETDEGNENEGFCNAIKNAFNKYNSSGWVKLEFEMKDWVPEGLLVAQGTKGFPTSIIRTLIPVRVQCELTTDHLPSIYSPLLIRKLFQQMPCCCSLVCILVKSYSTNGTEKQESH